LKNTLRERNLDIKEVFQDLGNDGRILFYNTYSTVKDDGNGVGP
jgi:hypothetical protein